VTTLLYVTLPSGSHQICDAKCHNSAGAVCHCPCGGKYHGHQEGSPALAYLVHVNQERILLDLGAREQRGELWIEAYRESLTDPLRWRRKGVARAIQEELLPR
jgi:hypothetical protein